MSTISVVINVCNEAHLLKDCLDSVAWADEIVITDMDSTDGSAEIYRQYTDQVYFHQRELIADLVHNFGFSRATGQWILKLDPDERVPPALARQLRDLIATEPDFVAVRIPFQNYIFGKFIRHTGWYPCHLLRFFRKDKVCWQPEVHSQPIVDGPVLTLPYDEEGNNAIIHVNYTDLRQFLEKFNRYTTAESQRIMRAGRPFKWYKLIYQPSRVFLRRFFLQQGFRDGMHGFVLSLLMAFYWMVSYMKLWELYRNASADHRHAPEAGQAQ